MTQKDIKLLWGRAASRCAICKIKLSELSSRDGFLIGEQAHIVGEKDTAARGNSNLTEDERNSYHNLILLCPNDHTIIDKNTDLYTVEKLHMIKSEHELWVEEQLATLNDNKDLAQEIVYTHIIDSMTEFCDFKHFDGWITLFCSPSMFMSFEVYEGLNLFRNMIFKAIFSGANEELERAIKSLSIVLGDLIDTFKLHINFSNNHYSCDRFYRNHGFHNPNYHEDLEKFNNWERRLVEICFSVTRVMNWVADVIRRDINPLFYVKEGKFTVTIGPDTNLENTTYLAELADEEKVLFPDCYKTSNLDEY